MKATEFDWRSGQVAYWSLDEIDPSVPLTQQLSELKEDLCQIVFEENTILDIGWYPEFSSEGRFVVHVIRGGEWNDPLATFECRTVRDLESVVHEAVSIAETWHVRN
jgi:hypothetical protein